MVSMASWAPLRRVNPCRTISSRDTCRNTSSSFSANLHYRPVQCKTPGSQNSRLRAHCSVVATAVEETATSATAGRERQWEVLGIDLRRPRRRESYECAACECFCDRQIALSRLANPCHSVFVCGSCCRFLPPMFWFNLSSSSLCPGRNPTHTASQIGTSNWASRKVCSLPDCCENRAIVVHEVADHLFFTLGIQSAQLAQWAASTPPALRLSESPAIPTNSQKHVHNALSWACMNAQDSGGRTMRRWKSTRGAAQYKRSNHVLRRSPGILCNRVACLVTTRRFRWWLQALSSRACVTLQTTASGSTTRALEVNSSMPAGSSPTIPHLCLAVVDLGTTQMSSK